ncbi:type I restriction endonuclease subunit R [Salinicoccus kekensis]|uniref:Type I restriction enzyme endonuclease subunit n=1 Tax=Salinicoccus kekensis TaxID=714307 RepID=A0A285UFV8_9STAP|nr:type I restriction endonuclease subunit R [Salinicoccus kekensis]SOC40750.1 type I restriction enzyme R subunit [Salinicoccus kekensis]
MSTQSELALESKVMDQLERVGYERAAIHNNESLEENFRLILNERHADKLDGQPLTDSEFKRLMIQINNKSVFDSARILRDKFVLKRDDETELYLEFFDSKNWCRNKFQVTNQISVEDKYKGRYDVTVLINGLPVMQIELKRRGVAINEAFNQVERYRRHNFTGLFRYTQLFVLSNYNDTRYYANNDKEIYKSHMFYWTDEENNRLTNVHEFIDSFMLPHHLAKMIGRYMVVDETDKNLIVLRPYQMYATEALIKRALETNNNGYIWHTTGSGKTLTSFKASQLLAQEKEIKKVIFLVDRKDLDTQTQKEFDKFEPGSVDYTDNTKHLLEQLEDKSKPMIITTIQKMANAVKSNAPVMHQYKEDKVIFVIDECHRSQFGDMHRMIRRHFQNSQYFGFTGTPRFDDNKSQDGRSTADIFDKCLHHYLIKDAIRDGNVLGFSIEYINTFKDKATSSGEEYVKAIDTNEIWMADDRIDMVARHIHSIHDNKTKDRQYSSIFATQSIDTAMKYYDKFREINHEAGSKPLNIATIFSYQANEDLREGDVKEHAKDRLARVIDDYNENYNTNFSLETYDQYFDDISKRMKKGIPGEKIDLLIVVNMFLTGFDSKVLNTLYVDKYLKHHDLIQAYSRTNRVEKQTKPYGNIVSYRDLKKETDEAIRLFSNTEDTDVVLSKSFEEYLEDFQAGMNELHTVVATPQDAYHLEDEEEIKAFIVSYRQTARALLKLKTFEEFDFTKTLLGVSEQGYEDYRSAYLDYYDKYVRQKDSEKVSVINDIDFEIEVIRNDKVNVSYILNLIGNIDLENKKKQAEERKQIKLMLERADDENLRLKADLIQEFLDEVLPKLDRNANIEKVYLDFEEDKKLQEFKNFAETEQYPVEQLRSLYTEYDYSGLLYRKDIEKGVTGGLLKKRKKVNKVYQFVKNVSRKFGLVE